MTFCSPRTFDILEGLGGEIYPFLGGILEALFRTGDGLRNSCWRGLRRDDARWKVPLRHPPWRRSDLPLDPVDTIRSSVQ
jgi:hypothetical protein